MLSLDNAARFVARDGHIARGIKQPVTVPSPAAGAQWSITVPAGETWQLYAGMYQFVTSAAVANRQPRILVQTEGKSIFTINDLTAITATQTVIYSVYMSDSPVPQASSQVVGQMQIPLIPLPQGSTIQSVTSAMDVADQYSAIVLYVARFYMTDQQADAYASDELTELLAAMTTVEVPK